MIMVGFCVGFARFARHDSRDGSVTACDTLIKIVLLHTVRYSRLQPYFRIYACAQRSDPPALMWWSENVSRHVLMLVVRKSRDVVVESRDLFVESRDLFVESRDRSRGISRLSRDCSWILETFLEIPRLPTTTSRESVR